VAKSSAAANENNPKHSSSTNKEKELLTFAKPPVGKRCSYLHCQLLNEVWEGVAPGCTPSSHSGALLAPELPWVGPSFPPGAQSLLQAVI